MFVTAEDFNLIPYSIPNLQLQANTFPDYVAEKERFILTQLLGLPLYTEFILGLNALPQEWDVATSYIIGAQVWSGLSIWTALTDNVGVAPIEGTDWSRVEINKWLMLRDGSPFAYYDSLYLWVGMKQLLVPYIYSQWLKDTFDSHTQLGVQESKSENSEKRAPSKRYEKAYNEFVMLAGSYENCNCGNVYIENVYSPTFYYNSLAGFLAASNAVEIPLYPTWQHCETLLPEHYNNFGI